MRDAMRFRPYVPAATAVALGIALWTTGEARLWGQIPTTRPVAGLRDHTPDRFAWTHVRLVVRPGLVVEDATLVVHHRVIVAAGKSVSIPPGTRRLDGTGKTIYPGFIDAYTETKVPPVSGGAPYWNDDVQPQRRVVDTYRPDAARNKMWRQAGFVARLVAPADGIVRGRSALVATSDDTDASCLIRHDVGLHVRLMPPPGRGRTKYPNSPMGAVALARQAFYDASWYREAWQAYHGDRRVGQPEVNDALAALEPFRGGKAPVIFDCPNERYLFRADRFAREFQLNAILLGSGREYRRLDAIAALHRPLIIPLAFPKAPDVGTPEAARNASLQSLLHWHFAPENPARLKRAGVTFALTTQGLEPKELRSKLRQAVARGWSADAALAALTTDAARILGVDSSLGTLEPGKLASFVVMDGAWLAPQTKLLETWVDGRRYRHIMPPPRDVRGRWKLTAGRTRLDLLIEGTPDQPKASLKAPTGGHAKAPKRGSKAPPKKSPRAAVPVSKLRHADDRIAGRFAADAWNRHGVARFSAVLLSTADGHLRWEGRLVWPDGESVLLTGTRVEPASRHRTGKPARDSKEGESRGKSEEEEKEQEKEKEKEAVGAKRSSEQAARQTASPAGGAAGGATGSEPRWPEPVVNYPLGAFGREHPPKRPEHVLFRGATVWTCAARGICSPCDVLVTRGKIAAVGTRIEPPAGATIVDCRGKHLTPGIIDCHSHMATDGGVNESTQAITAEVRIGDFINEDDINIYRQLAGGVTTSNILHGSANPIGGQNQVIKLRWGALSETMKFRRAPPGIKFALGENVKQSNWGDEFRSRYPQTRMGVEQIIRDAFREAQRYERRWREWDQHHRGIPPRKDLELEALVEVLQHRRWIHCHSYRQDEIVALLRTLESFHIRIGSLQHILEGYKVADVLREHGATASAFSDWWAYKFEVYDAIPYNGALMHQVGIVVSFNSDDREMARHLNHEAAKAVKYGGVPREEALKFVTLNPARQLRIDRYVGSIEPGKDADLVVWSGDPLSPMTRCEETWIDGRKYFDRREDETRQAYWRAMKQGLIQRILASGAPMRKPGEKESSRDVEWPTGDAFCHHQHP